MLKRLLKSGAVLLVMGLAYLLFWPVPIDPVAWDAPETEGYTGDFAADERLEALDRISLGNHSGPEDVAVGPDNLVYISTHDGAILKFDPASGNITEFANTQGRPLGIEFGNDGVLYVADAYRGLLQLDAGGEITVLADETTDGSPILYADDLDITSEAITYFSDASTKFGDSPN